MEIKPFYVQRGWNGEATDLLVYDWHYAAWPGCFCLISDKAKWL